MIPNKKNTNGWILCPSKSFPGKFYYFNVASGETAWCLNETEKKSIKTPTFQNIDHAHSYPEPSGSPPLEFPPSTKTTIHSNLYSRQIENNIWRKTAQNYPKNRNCTNRNVPNNVSTFLIQPPYQNYSNSAMPIQIQVPVVTGTDYQNHTPVVMILMNQNPQYSQLAIEEPKFVPVETEIETARDLFVNSETIPLCKRFVNYEKPVLQFENNKIKRPFHTYNSSTPKKYVSHSNQSSKSPVTYENCSYDINCQSKIDSHGKLVTPQKNLENPTNNKVNQNRSIFSPIFELDSPKNVTKNSSSVFPNCLNGNIFGDRNLEENPFSPKSTLNQWDKVDIATSPINASVTKNCDGNNSPFLIAKENTALIQGDKVDVLVSNDEENLDQNDLRRVLMAKRKVRNSEKSVVESKKIKTSKQDCPTVTPKKKVTFNLFPENMSNISSADNFSNNGDLNPYDKEPDGAIMMRQLKHLRSPSTGGMWYLVVDTTTLIHELAYLEKLVQIDPDCYLLIPSRVMSDTSALARAECRDRSVVTLARNTLRRLATPRSYIAVEQSSHKDDLTQTSCDSILNCCLEVIEQNSHVVLITADTNLRNKAESKNIPCFDCDQIKKGSAQKPKVHFDTKKIKISIKNDITENQESTDVLKNENSTKNRRSIFENLPKNETGKTDGGNSNLNIQFNSKFKNPTTLKKANVQNLNETVSCYFQNGNSNFESKIDGRTKNEELPQTVSFYFQNKKKNENNISSIFNQTNEKLEKNKSIFEIDGIEKIESNIKKPSINEIKKSIFEEEMKNENLKMCDFEKTDENLKNGVQSKNSITKKCENKSIFEIDFNNHILLPPKTYYADIDEYVKKFFLKNEIEEERIEEIKEELICNFEQVMEECLTNVLQVSKSIHTCQPPWTMQEAIQILVKVYSKHTNIRTGVNILLSVLNAKDKITPSDILKIIACGILLVRYLKKILPKCDVLNDTEHDLNTIVRNLTDQNYGVSVLPEKPAVTNEILKNENRRRNFVKDRSEVVKYLKNHFSGWANYDEALEETKSKASWGQIYKEGTNIVRTLGKNIGSLKISKSKKMILSQSNDCDTEKIVQNDSNTIHNKDDYNTILQTSNDIVAKNEHHFEKNDKIKLTLNRGDKQKYENDMINTNMTRTSTDVKGANKMGDSKTAEPKVIRLFNNFNLTRDNTAINSAKSVCNIDYSHGHTFGTESTGPKVVRNMQMIKEFEEKLKSQEIPLDMDKLDYSAISESNDGLSLQTDTNCQWVIDEKCELNDDITQKNDTQIYDTENNGCTTNNDSYSMSLDNCVSNDVPKLNDSKNYSAINDYSLKNDNYIGSDRVSCLNIINNGTFYDDFYTKDFINFEVNDSYATNDTKVTQKDDTTNDSGFENESFLTYSIMKSFLYEINGSFKLVHKFIEGSVQVFRAGSLQEGKKQALHSIASAAKAQISKIIDKLKCIIQRETSDDTNLKTLFVSQYVDDKQISRYKHKIAQCLKQAEMLEQGLKMMLSITDSSNANSLVKN